MKTDLFKYLRSNFPQDTEMMDRLIISAYLEINDISVGKNEFLKAYIIQPSDSDFDDLDLEFNFPLNHPSRPSVINQ